MTLNRILLLKYENSLLVALYLFQFSFLVILIPLISISFSSILFSMLLLVVHALKNKRKIFRIPQSVFIFCQVVLFMIVFKYVQFVDETASTTNTLFNFISVGVLSIYFGSMKFDINEFLNWGRKISFFTFLGLSILPFLGIDKFDGYMRYGYALLPIVNFFLYDCVEVRNKKILHIVLYIFALLEMIVFGARGAFFSHLLYVACIFFVVYKPTQKLLFKTLVLTVSVGIGANLEKIVFAVKLFLNSKGYRVYAIDKYIMQLNGGFEYAASGRNDIWHSGVNMIQKYPFFGGTIGKIEEGNIDYYHNFFIQLGAEFGIIILVMTLITITYISIKIGKGNEKKKKYLYFFFFSIAFGRLMFSSSYWLRPELWMLIGMYLSNTFIKETG